MASKNITEYDVNTFRFFTRTEHFLSIRHPEDGTLLEGTEVYVIGEAPDGVQFAHHIGTSDWKESVDEESGEPIVICDHPLHDLIDQADQMVEHLTNRSNGDGTFNNPSLTLFPSRWPFYGAVYGSEGYQILSMEEELRAYD